MDGRADYFDVIEDMDELHEYAIEYDRSPLRVYRLRDGSFSAYAWPGGYPLYYVTLHGDTLCAKCADDDQDVEDLKAIEGVDTNWEEIDLYCDDCSERIPSAYCEDDREEIIEASEGGE